MGLSAYAGKLGKAGSAAKDPVAAAAQHDHVHRGVLALITYAFGQSSQ